MINNFLTEQAARLDIFKGSQLFFNSSRWIQTMRGGSTIDSRKKSSTHTVKPPLMIGVQ